MEEYINDEEHDQVIEIATEIINGESMIIADIIKLVEEMDVPLKIKLAVMFILGLNDEKYPKVNVSTIISTQN
jgi:hypothetical protein